jgi:hypothetical protein
MARFHASVSSVTPSKRAPYSMGENSVLTGGGGSAATGSAERHSSAIAGSGNRNIMAFSFVMLTNIHGSGGRRLGAGARKQLSDAIPSRAAKPQVHHRMARLR